MMRSMDAWQQFVRLVPILYTDALAVVLTGIILVRCLQVSWALHTFSVQVLVSANTDTRFCVSSSALEFGLLLRQLAKLTSIDVREHVVAPTIAYPVQLLSCSAGSIDHTERVFRDIAWITTRRRGKNDAALGPPARN
jgi:hypothetical protein